LSHKETVLPISIITQDSSSSSHYVSPYFTELY